LSVSLVLLDRMVQLAEEGVAIAVRIDNLAHSSLRAVKLGEVHQVPVARQDYLQPNGTPTQVADLRGQAVIAFSGINPNDEWRDSGRRAGPPCT
jgi:DNA-binding transcriptional LysR family regulator